MITGLPLNDAKVDRCKGGQSKEMADLPVFRNTNEKQYRMQEERKRRALSKVQFALEGRPQTR